MNKVDNYLSLKRIVLLSLAITLAYYVLFVLMHYFSRPMFDNPIEVENWDNRNVDVLAADTLQLTETQPCPIPEPRYHRPGPPEPPKGRWLYKVLVNIPLTFIMVFIVLLYDRKIMSLMFKKKRGEFLAIVFGSIFVGIIMSTLCIVFQWFGWPSWRPNHSLFICVVKGWLGDLPLYAFAVLSAYLFRSVYLQKKSAVENETLRAESIRSRYEALKNQLDPHFLFNSMNTLQSLITVDSDSAEEYVQQLSTVMRYTLQKREVVTLVEELKCAADYSRMLKMRYGDNLVFDHHIDHERYDNHLVLPLAVQGLIENAIKHNVISAKQPLTIHLSTDDDNHLIIKNKKQPKISEEEGTGIGLANLTERYRLQWDKKVQIFDDGNNFIVILPLVND